jgi:ankyrin repeat protein
MQSTTILKSKNHLFELPTNLIAHIFTFLPLTDATRVAYFIGWLNKHFQSPMPSLSDSAPAQLYDSVQMTTTCANVYWKSQFDYYFPGLSSTPSQELLASLSPTIKPLLDDKKHSLPVQPVNTSALSIPSYTQSKPATAFYIWKDLFRKTRREMEFPEPLRKLFKKTRSNLLEEIKEMKEPIPLDYFPQIDGSGKSLIHWAQASGNQKILDYFYNIIKAHYQRNIGLATLCSRYMSIGDALYGLLYWVIMCRQGPAELANLQLASNVINASCYLTSADGTVGVMPLHLAILQNDEACVDYLIQNKADLDDSGCIYRGRKYETFLGMALEQENDEIVESLRKSHEENGAASLSVVLKKLMVSAITSGSNKIVDFILSNAKYVNLVNKNSDCAFLESSYEITTHAQLDIACKIIKAGVEISKASVDKHEQSYSLRILLKKAILNQHVELVRAMIDACPSIVNDTSILCNDNHYHRPIYYAMQIGNIAVVKEFLQNGTIEADFFSCDLIVAAAHENLAMFELIFEKLSVDDRYTILVKVIDENKPENSILIERILERHPDLLTYDNVNRPASSVIYAIYTAGYRDLYKKLITQDSALIIENDSLIGKIFERDDQESIQVLQEMKADLTYALVPIVQMSKMDLLQKMVTDSAKANILCYGQPIIHFAASAERLDTLQYLHQQGADLNAVPVPEKNPFFMENATALHWAAKKGHLDIVKYLLENKATLDCQQGNFQVTPLGVALLKNHSDVVNYLLDAKANPALAVNEMAEVGRLDLVKRVVEEYPDQLEHKDYRQQTPLLFAASYGHAELVSFLLEKKADISAATAEKAGDNYGGRTALVWAHEHKHTPVVEILLQHLGKDAVKGIGNNAEAYPELLALAQTVVKKSEGVEEIKAIDEPVNDQKHSGQRTHDLKASISNNHAYSFISEIHARYGIVGDVNTYQNEDGKHVMTVTTHEFKQLIELYRHQSKRLPIEFSPIQNSGNYRLTITDLQYKKIRSENIEIVNTLKIKLECYQRAHQKKGASFFLHPSTEKANSTNKLLEALSTGNDSTTAQKLIKFRQAYTPDVARELGKDRSRWGTYLVKCIALLFSLGARQVTVNPLSVAGKGLTRELNHLIFSKHTLMATERQLVKDDAQQQLRNGPVAKSRFR